MFAKNRVSRMGRRTGCFIENYQISIFLVKFESDRKNFPPNSSNKQILA